MNTHVKSHRLTGVASEMVVRGWVSGRAGASLVQLLQGHLEQRQSCYSRCLQTPPPSVGFLPPAVSSRKDEIGVKVDCRLIQICQLWNQLVQISISK